MEVFEEVEYSDKGDMVSKPALLAVEDIPAHTKSSRCAEEKVK